jgi:tRNA(Arg) A34 adenosine deaminase TadA
MKIPPLPDEFMHAAIEEACAGLDEGGIPIGSVLVHAGVLSVAGTTAACVSMCCRIRSASGS